MKPLSRFIFTITLVLLTACASLNSERLPSLSCEGPIGETTTRTDLTSSFGPENVRDEEIEVGEGETVDGTAIFPDDEERRVEIVWVNPDRKNRVASIRVSAPSEWAIEGLRTGLDLETVMRLNGRPFTLYGFEWDYAGTVASWNGGAFDLSGACRLLARFSPNDSARSDTNLAGEEVYGSDDPRMRGVNPEIYELLLLFE